MAAVSLSAAEPGATRVVRLVIARGTRTARIAQQLAAVGLIRSPLAFEVLALWRHDTGRLQAGEYDFSPGMTPLTILTRIVDGDVVTYRVVVPEGADVKQVAAAVSAAGLASEADILTAAEDPSLVAAWLPAGAPVRYPAEGYLFPATYKFTRADGPRAILLAMVDRMRQALTPALVAAASAQGLSVNQLVTLASIVQRETSDPAEEPAVAAVFLNRLKAGMHLQSDTTVLYALNRRGGSLDDADLRVDSPYNTYEHAGLPPGPIASPGLAALQAVAHPAAVPYLFFLARPDGKLVFAQTYQQQLANERAYLGGSH